MLFDNGAIDVDDGQLVWEKVHSCFLLTGFALVFPWACLLWSHHGERIVGTIQPQSPAIQHSGSSIAVAKTLGRWEYESIAIVLVWFEVHKEEVVVVGTVYRHKHPCFEKQMVAGHHWASAHHGLGRWDALSSSHPAPRSSLGQWLNISILQSTYHLPMIFMVVLFQNKPLYDSDLLQSCCGFGISWVSWCWRFATFATPLHVEGFFFWNFDLRTSSFLRHQ